MEFCSIASSSSGNCFYVGSNNTHLLIDTGISKKRIVEGLNLCGLTLKDMDGILITHEHLDHIKSIHLICKEINYPIYYCTLGTLQGIKKNNFNTINYNLFNIINNNATFQIGDILINAIPIFHDALDPCAYCFTSNNKKFAIITDTGTFDNKIITSLQHLDGLLLESNYDVKMLEVGSYPYYVKQRIASDYGHLSNESAGELLNKIINSHLYNIFLGHLSKHNNIPELAYETVKLEITLDDSNPYKGDELNIKIVDKNKPMKKIQL